MALTREEVLNADDRPIEKVSVPEWGGHVNIRVLGGADRDLFEAAAHAGNNKNLRARIAAKCICDDEGKHVFTEQDIIRLGTKSGIALDRVFAAALTQSKMSEADMVALVGNSEAAPSGDSGSS